MSGNIKDAVKEKYGEAEVAAAGFEDITVEPTRIYHVDAVAPQIDGRFMSAFVRARKPGNPSESGSCS
jgi:hypothetical protein